MKNLKILAAVVTITLGGCIHEGDPPPPPEIRGEWFAVDMDFKLFVAAGQDPVEARYEGRYGSGGIGGHFVLDNPVGPFDTLALILRRR